MNKCKFYDYCPLVQSDGHTCNHQDEAKSYCGKYQENQKHGLIKFQKKNR